ncbi:head completion/stabilization protein [Sphingosinicella sp. CPCC 101087]|uniref:head completion/stabilization protein n=1 Tax=Sphingosinicella sp. CPCC 101087 TaxID=2497754 RepID=UPI00101D906F|nr:head completion/stabilization protein [Sphingosinicella sp. CPCC 101087]
MSGFVASPPSTPPDPQQPGLDLVAGDEFYPAVSIAEFRDSMRLGTVITDVRARDALRGAMVTVRRDLRDWKARHVAAGAVSMEDVDSEEIDGELALELLYRRAVFAFGAADLAETHNDISATSDGKERTEERTLSVDEHKRNGLHAIRDIIGVGRTAVELI